MKLKPTVRGRGADAYDKPDWNSFIHRSWLKRQDLPDDVFGARPATDIRSTSLDDSDLNALMAAGYTLADRKPD